MSFVSKLILFLMLFIMGFTIYSYGYKFNEFYVNLFINDNKKPDYWEFSSSKEFTDREAKRAGLGLMIVAVFLAFAFTIDHFYK